MPVLELLLALALSSALCLAALAGWLARRQRAAEHTAARRGQLLATLGAVSVEAGTDDPVPSVASALAQLGCRDARLLLFDEPSGRWVRRPACPEADGSVERSVARAAERAWDRGSAVTADPAGAGPGGLIACPVRTGTGVPVVLVARAISPQEIDDARAAVEVCAGLLGASQPVLQPPVGDREAPAAREAGPLDSLTGLGTASSFYAAMERRCRKGEPVALLLIAVDGVEAVTGQYGSRSGDEVVRVAARRLQRCVRPDDVLARVDPTIFGVLLAEASHPDGAGAVGSRALAALDSPVAITGAEAQISGRVAVVWDASGSQASAALLPEARSALSRVGGGVATTIRLGDPIAPDGRPAR